MLEIAATYGVEWVDEEWNKEELDMQSLSVRGRGRKKRGQMCNFSLVRDVVPTWKIPLPISRAQLTESQIAVSLMYTISRRNQEWLDWN